MAALAMRATTDAMAALATARLGIGRNNDGRRECSKHRYNHQFCEQLHLLSSRLSASG
jgi:hypothetical protein